MPEVQNTFAREQDSYFEGQPTDSRYDSNSKVVETAAGIAFGKPIFEGAADGGGAKARALVAAGSEDAANTGTGTVTDAPVATAEAKTGRYTALLMATSATGEYVVSDPDGFVVGTGNIASAFTGGGLTFTWANAGTMTLGDKAYIDVTGPSLLGITLRDKGRSPTDEDMIPQYAPGGYMERGSIAVRTADAVVRDAQVYWDATADRFTDASGVGKFPCPGWRFEATSSAAGLIPVRKV